MPARLTLHYSDQPARTVVAENAREYLIGRGPECDVVVDDTRVSRRHARLTVSGDGAEIVDLQSKNGTEVDGLPIESRRLTGTSWISLGGLLMHLEHGGDALAADPRGAAQEHNLREHFTLSEAGSSVGDLVRRLLDSFLRLSGTERGFVLLAGTAGGFDVVACTGLSEGDLRHEDFSGSASTVDRVLADSRPFVRSDVRLDALSGARPSVVRHEIRALVCVPLRAAGHTIGAVYADSRRPGKSFGELDIDILNALAGHAAIAVWSAGLRDELDALSGDLPTRAERPTPATSALPGFPTWGSTPVASPDGDRA